METGFIEKVMQLNNQQELESSQLFTALSSYINEMLVHHFGDLINLLYRMDIDETKLKLLLKEYSQQDAGDIIARLIIERQLQKIKTLHLFSTAATEGSDEERW